MKTILTMISAGLLFITTSCDKTQEVKPASDNSSTVSRPMAQISPAVFMPAQTPVYYNGRIFNVKLQADNPSPYLTHVLVNSLYMISAPSLPGTTAPRFIPIMNALPTVKFDASTIWEVVSITFTSNVGIRPYQLQSLDEIDKLLAQPNPLITENKTGAYFEASLSFNQPVVTK